MATKKRAPKKDKGFTGTMTVKYVGPSIDKLETLESLEKARDLAAARMVCANQQKRYWDRQLYVRHQEFDHALITLMKKKHGFSDDEISREQTESTAVWTYAK